MKPEEKPTTLSTGKFDLSFNPNLPVVHHLTNTGLIDIGFQFYEKVYTKNGQGWKMVYKRGKDEVSYDGTWFLFNGKQVQFFEDLE